MSVQTSNNSIKMEALSRFSSLPLVNSAINLATDGYSRIKGYNSLISATLSRAEQSIAFMASTAQPVIQKFEKPISFADNIACQGLDKLQEKVPAIKKSPEELKDGTKKLVEDGVSRIRVVRKYSTDKIQGIKDYGYNKVNGVLDLPYVRVFIKSIDTAIDLTDKAVDHYLPAAANEPLEDDETKGKQTVVVRMSHLSEKMRRRMYNQFAAKWVPTVMDTINHLKSNVLNWVQNNRSQQTNQ
jgi:perilipin-2